MTPAALSPPRLLVVGLNHRSAPIEIRERFAVGSGRLEAILHEIVGHPSILECVVLSTCNRTEYYVASREPESAAAATIGCMAREADLDSGRAARYLFRHEGLDAVTHLYRVTAGLDSLVIGEPQIQGQVGVAYDVGRGRVPASVGPVLHRLFQSAAAAGGRVRAGTRIAHGSASIPSAAVNLARKVFGALAGRSVLVVGTGEIGALTARCLQAEGVGRIVVASRDLDRAARFARRIGGEPIVREDAWARVDEVDLVVTASRADGAFVAPSRLAERDGRRDLVVLDIALPRNVDPGVGDLPGVFLYNIDDLQRVVDAAEHSRTGEMEKAEAIVARHAARFWDWYRVRGAVPAIRRLREGVAALGRGALDDRLAEVGGEEDAEALRLATRAALNKILHVPTQALRVIARDEVASEHLEAVLGLLDRPVEASGGGSSETPRRRVANEGREGG